jgi:cell division protein FtsB
MLDAVHSSVRCDSNEPWPVPAVKKLTAFLLVLIALLQYRLWFGDGNIRELHRLGDHIEELKQEGEKRRERNAAFEAEVMDLKQGTDAIEERARHELGMIKEGEVFIQVIDHHPEAKPSPPAAQSEKPKSEQADRRRKLRRERRSQEAPVAPDANAGGALPPAER